MAKELILSQLKEQMEVGQAETRAIQIKFDGRLNKLQSSMDAPVAQFNEQMELLRQN